MSKVYVMETNQYKDTFSAIEDRNDIYIYIERKDETIKITPNELSQILKILNIK